MRKRTLKENPSTLSTPYADGIKGQCPWNIYPRPQMVRDSFFCLNGEWEFSTTRADGIPDYKEKILVPYPPESKLSGIERRIHPKQTLHYRRTFSLPEGFIKDRLILHFGAVDCIARVEINGKEVCRHEGGYLPFSVDITDYYKSGENTVTLTVKDGTSKKYPYGKQKEKRGGMWYTPVSGIWQTVWLESIPEGAIEEFKIEHHLEYVNITVKSKAENIKLRLKGDDEVYTFKNGKLTLAPKDRRSWSPDDPYLYYFEVTSDTDRIESYFALREIGTYTDSEGIARTTLNGKPYFFSGLLDQGYFPDGIFLPATPEGYADDIKRAKEMGFNMLRKHIKIEPMIFYHLCDKLGMIVFQDMVSSGSYSFFWDTALPTLGIRFGFSSLRNSDPEARAIFKNSMLSTAEHLLCCPSVLQYTVFNEGWGQFSSDEMYRALKEKDPTRLIDSTSGWFAGRLSDFDSRHVYFKKPRLKHPDGRPFFLSEFGGFALRCEGHLFGNNNYGYSTYRSSDELYDAIRSLYLEDVLPLIKMGLCALVYTQLTDVEDETNGLITYDRRLIKIEPGLMWAINDALAEEFQRITDKK